MISNLINQLKQLGELDRLNDVLNELPVVRKELGQVPLVTPTSQIVGIQTVNNVLYDHKQKRYTKITQQVKDLCYGLYGKTSEPIDPEIQKQALKDYPRGENPIVCRPGDILKPEFEEAKLKIEHITKNVDDILIYALFPITGERFLKWKFGLEGIPDEAMPITLEHVEKEKKLVEKAISGNLLENPNKDIPQEKPNNLKNFDLYIDDEYFKIEIGEEQKDS